MRWAQRAYEHGFWTAKAHVAGSMYQMLASINLMVPLTACIVMFYACRGLGAGLWVSAHWRHGARLWASLDR
jgi:hypothetical protein